MEVVKVSCTSGEGLDEWMQWLENRRKSVASAAAQAVT
jgi:hypothetical protein